MEGSIMSYYLRDRKYPRVVSNNQKEPEQKDRIVDLSMAAAMGIVVLAFAKGMFWGYLLKRRLG
jgi:hypothetical protein